jgi:hypothetical protein
MLKAIPWDVWLAAASAAAVVLAAIFESAPVALIVGYLVLCAYIAVQVISDELA